MSDWQEGDLVRPVKEYRVRAVYSDGFVLQADQEGCTFETFISREKAEKEWEKVEVKMGSNNMVTERPFAALVRRELERARRLHAPINSVHEGYAVLLEEVDEFWEHVKRRSSARVPREMLVELVQVAAMCQRVAEDTLSAVLEGQ
jgi:hypothetical protein